MQANRSQEHVSLYIEPWGLETSQPKGLNIMLALNKEGIYFKNACGGDGSCGRCKIEISEEGNQEYQEILSCKSSLSKDVRIKIPPEMVLDL